MNAVDLAKRMEKADWFYDYTEDHDVWLRGNIEINGIKKDLEGLCSLNGGKTIANTLWDAYVPEFSISKPSFLEWTSDLEQRMDSYDWSEAFHDPLHDFIEADTDEAKQEHAAMETLIEDLQKRFVENPQEVKTLVERYWMNQPMEEQIKLLFNQVNENVMNEKNLEHLQKDLKYLGFGDALNEALEKNISEKKPDFTLQMQFEYGNRNMMTDLSFKAGKENDMYFFNNYRATMQDNPELSQLFYIDKGKGMTTKEAFNLLEGRAVNKDLTNREGQEYNAWLQLNFRETEENGNYKVNRYHENYNYDLPKAVSELVLKPMPAEEEQKLMTSLAKGNIQSATFLKEGQEVQLFIEASPKERTINIYDKKMNPLSEEKKQDFLDLPGSSNKQQKQANGAAGDDGDDTDPGLKKKRTRKQGNGQSV